MFGGGSYNGDGESKDDGGSLASLPSVVVGRYGSFGHNDVSLHSDESKSDQEGPVESELTRQILQRISMLRHGGNNTLEDSFLVGRGGGESKVEEPVSPEAQQPGFSVGESVLARQILQRIQILQTSYGEVQRNNSTLRTVLKVNGPDEEIEPPGDHFDDTPLMDQPPLDPTQLESLAAENRQLRVILAQRTQELDDLSNAKKDLEENLVMAKVEIQTHMQTLKDAEEKRKDMTESLIGKITLLESSVELLEKESNDKMERVLAESPNEEARDHARDKQELVILKREKQVLESKLKEAVKSAKSNKRDQETAEATAVSLKMQKASLMEKLLVLEINAKENASILEETRATLQKYKIDKEKLAAANGYMFKSMKQAKEEAEELQDKLHEQQASDARIAELEQEKELLRQELDAKLKISLAEKENLKSSLDLLMKNHEEVTTAKDAAEAALIQAKAEIEELHTAKGTPQEGKMMASRVKSLEADLAMTKRELERTRKFQPTQNKAPAVDSGPQRQTASAHARPVPRSAGKKNVRVLRHQRIKRSKSMEDGPRKRIDSTPMPRPRAPRSKSFDESKPGKETDADVHDMATPKAGPKPLVGSVEEEGTPKTQTPTGDGGEEAQPMVGPKKVAQAIQSKAAGIRRTMSGGALKSTGESKISRIKRTMSGGDLSPRLTRTVSNAVSGSVKTVKEASQAVQKGIAQLSPKKVGTSVASLLRIDITGTVDEEGEASAEQEKHEETETKEAIDEAALTAVKDNDVEEDAKPTDDPDTATEESKEEVKEDDDAEELIVEGDVDRSLRDKRRELRRGRAHFDEEWVSYKLRNKMLRPRSPISDRQKLKFKREMHQYQHQTREKMRKLKEQRRRLQEDQWKKLSAAPEPKVEEKDEEEEKREEEGDLVDESEQAAWFKAAAAEKGWFGEPLHELPDNSEDSKEIMVDEMSEAGEPVDPDAQTVKRAPLTSNQKKKIEVKTLQARLKRLERKSMATAREKKEMEKIKKKIAKTQKTIIIEPIVTLVPAQQQQEDDESSEESEYEPNFFMRNIKWFCFPCRCAFKCVFCCLRCVCLPCRCCCGCPCLRTKAERVKRTKGTFRREYDTKLKEEGGPIQRCCCWPCRCFNTYCFPFIRMALIPCRTILPCVKKCLEDSDADRER